jgi:hypothetical protein
VKVSDLAKELDVEVAVVKELSGKTAANAMLSKEEVETVSEKVLEHRASSEAPVVEGPAPAPEAPKPEGPVVVRFWSEIRKHTVVVNETVNGAPKRSLLKFEDYLLAVEKGSEAFRAVVETQDPSIRVLVDNPFTDVGKRKDFRMLLENKIFTGPNREPSIIRGFAFLQSLFRRKEHDALSKIMEEHGVEALIEHALQTKSYIDLVQYAAGK